MDHPNTKYARGFTAYLLSNSMLQLAWGIFWAVFVFSVSAIHSAYAPFWIALIYFVGPVTTGIASLIVPFLHKQRAVYTFISTQTLELLLIPLYIVLLESGFLAIFALLVGINGTLDEVGEGVLAPVLKVTCSTKIERGVSLQRSISLLGRFSGYLIGGIAYGIIKNYAYLIMSTVLVVSVLVSLFIHQKELRVASRVGLDPNATDDASVLSSVREAWYGFKRGPGLRFTFPFILGNLLDGTAILVITLILIDSLKVSSLEYGILLAILLLASSGGALLLGYVHWSKAKVIALAFASTGIGVTVYAFDARLIIFFIVGTMITLVGAMGQTALSQVLYSSYKTEQIAIVNQMMIFMTTVPFALGSLLGGLLFVDLTAKYALLLLAPFYFVIAILTMISLRKRRSVYAPIVSQQSESRNLSDGGQSDG